MVEPGKIFQYDHPHPAVTTDIAVFTVRDGKLFVLLIERGAEPFKGAWALPGGFIRMDEGLAEGAARELAEEAGIENAPIFQVGAFGAPGRDPRERVITVAFTCLVGTDEYSPVAGSDAAKAEWCDMGSLPSLAFDHREIIEDCRRIIIERLEIDRLALRLIDPVFTLPDLQAVHQAVLGVPMDRRNFRKRLLASWPLAEVEAPRRQGAGRPPSHYTVKTE
jgi:8-oxo-dGTP diphosphatase